ncbi:MAG: homoserine dehydrogenase [Tissierellia bacterium]|nr:homoserine dehydrogenase [Tissierellia bacterium]
MIKIGLMGFGTVGKATYEILNEQRENIENFIGSYEIEKILVRDLKKHNYENIDKAIFTDNIEEFADSSLNVIIELTGSIDEIYPYMIKQMKDSKNIISANKAFISKYFEQLTEIAITENISFQYEAAIGGAIPIIEELKIIKALNEIDSVCGVLNGTCNFILSKMESGKDYEAALIEAQAIGFAEADPSADVEGLDTLRKLRILASLAFGKPVLEEQIELEGITKLERKELEKAIENSERIKLVAEAKMLKTGEVIAKVAPKSVPIDSVLGGLIDGENAVILNCSNAGELVFKGAGAGGRATAFSVISDLINIYRKERRA